MFHVMKVEIQKESDEVTDFSYATFDTFWDAKEFADANTGQSGGLAKYCEVFDDDTDGLVYTTRPSIETDTIKLGA